MLFRSPEPDSPFGELIRNQEMREKLTVIKVGEIAYSLGFKYPQHFSRLFKQKVGVTPNEYRMRN